MDAQVELYEITEIRNSLIRYLVYLKKDKTRGARILRRQKFLQENKTAEDIMMEQLRDIEYKRHNILLGMEYLPSKL
jgi:hypothetical protein